MPNLSLHRLRFECMVASCYAVTFVFVLGSVSLAQETVAISSDNQAVLSKALTQAGENRPELEKVLADVPIANKQSAEFLIANMPPRDLASLKSDFLLSEIELAHRALEAAPWKDTIPKEIFLNNILPYVSINERRDAWRKDFRDRFAPLIEG
ncbi:MAG: hypothetical protein ACKOOI_19925, partial [Pirellula sp.]